MRPQANTNQKVRKCYIQQDTLQTPILLFLEKYKRLVVTELNNLKQHTQMLQDKNCWRDQWLLQQLEKGAQIFNAKNYYGGSYHIFYDMLLQICFPGADFTEFQKITSGKDDNDDETLRRKLQEVKQAINATQICANHLKLLSSYEKCFEIFMRQFTDTMKSYCSRHYLVVFPDNSCHMTVSPKLEDLRNVVSIDFESDHVKQILNLSREQRSQTNHIETVKQFNDCILQMIQCWREA